MKVKIGPYRSRWISNVHDRHMNIKYGRFEWDDNKDWEDRAWERFEDALQWLYNKTINIILDKRSNQKIKVRIDPHDTWSMDNTLAYIILPMLKQLREKMHGGPQVDIEDVPEHLHPTEEELAAYNKDGSTDGKFFMRWEWVMDEMIWAFEQVNSEWEEQYTTGEYDWIFEKTEDGMLSEMKQGPNHTAVTDWDGRKKHQERMSNGFRLFGKYYQALWD